MWKSYFLTTPNGRHIVYVVAGEEMKVWVRDLGLDEPRELDGTEGARAVFWSPDSQFIGFFTIEGLKKIPVQGGPAITLCALPPAARPQGAWSPDGSAIAFSAGGPPRIYEIPARGGEPKLSFEQRASVRGGAYSSPHLLPLVTQARSIIFSVGTGGGSDLVVRNTETGESVTLTRGEYPVYSNTGHILYQTAGDTAGLWALPFSIETLKPTGEAFPIIENAGNPSVAEDGTLVYVDFQGRKDQLVWRARTGEALGRIGQPQGAIRYPALSPDGSRVAVMGSG